MAVGYSLGNKSDEESDILVLGEEDPDVITFSRSVPISLTRICRNNCPYCGFQKRDNLVVPYSTIRAAKKARSEGVREAYYVAGERPDQFSHIRSLLDLWGFESYLDYLYTVCELGFLEGLIPVLNLGFLKPDELKRLREISAVMKVMFDSVDDKHFDTIYPKSPGKQMDIRSRSVEWATKLRIPVITGVMVGIGETKDHRRKTLERIRDIHLNNGFIHEVLIQPFFPQKGTLFEDKNPALEKNVLDTYQLAREIIPEDVPITVPVEAISNLKLFIKAGLRDLGRLFEKPLFVKYPNAPLNFEDIESVVTKNGFRLQQRFPLRRQYIKEGMYSKKLGQVFDAYRYKVKKDAQEKQKAQ